MIERNKFSLDEIAAAICFQMRGYDKRTQMLPPEANELCNIYGIMLYERADSIPINALSDLQRKYVAEALSGQQRLDIEHCRIEEIETDVIPVASELVDMVGHGGSQDIQRTTSVLKE
jgi:hypothetical protein